MKGSGTVQPGGRRHEKKVWNSKRRTLIRWKRYGNELKTKHELAVGSPDLPGIEMRPGYLILGGDFELVRILSEEQLNHVAFAMDDHFEAMLPNLSHRDAFFGLVDKCLKSVLSLNVSFRVKLIAAGDEVRAGYRFFPLGRNTTLVISKPS